MICEPLSPTPEEVVCTACGSDDLIYAVDVTKYYSVKALTPQTVVAENTGQEIVDGDNGTRLFCADCGEYFVPPEEEELS